MDNNIKVREMYVRKILEAIPSYINPVDYLTDILKISRVSVYRRIKCKVPFTFDEIIALSSELNFPIEEIIPSKNKATFTYLDADNLNPTPQKYFHSTIKRIFDNISNETLHNNRKAIIVLNHLWLMNVMGYKNLLNFYYYKWLHQSNIILSNTLLCHVRIPANIINLSQKIATLKASLHNSTYIIDKNIFINTITEIEYYYKRKLISKDELIHLVNELGTIIDKVEKQILNGRNETGTKISYYLSYLKLHSNSVYAEYGENERHSFFYEYDISPMATSNNEICSAHKDWLRSLKKYTILMSASNEALRMDYFREQREYLDLLLNNKALFVNDSFF